MSAGIGIAVRWTATPYGPTNADGSCLWCGRKLRAPRYPGAAADFGRRGDYADGAFCGLRCGYSFGVTLARIGKRLLPVDDAVSS